MPTHEYPASLPTTSLEDFNAGLRGGTLSTEDIATYQREGVLIVQDAVPQYLVDEANRACDLLDQHALKMTSLHPDINLEADGGGWYSQKEIGKGYAGKIRKVKNLVDHGAVFREIATSPGILRAMTALLGSCFQMHSKGFWMNKPTEVSSEKPWHQDGAYFDSPAQVITVWIPLQDVDEGNGCLFAIPGSHLVGPIPHFGAEAQIDITRLNIGEPQPYAMRQGSFILMDKHTAHYSGENRTQNPRRALLFRYEEKQI